MDSNIKYLFGCITFCILGFFMLLYKTNSCSSYSECKDSFHKMEGYDRVTCDPGAKGEIVTSPEKGLLCKCLLPGVDGGD